MIRISVYQLTDKVNNIKTDLLLQEDIPIINVYCRQYRQCTLKLKNMTKNGFQERLSFNAGQKYCRMLQWEHSAILSTFIKLPFVIKIFFV